jgi:sec-independent protein translocase protein TatB
MFDFAWSEIAVIGVVALIAIGPKDMPMAIRAMTNALKKARRMAGEFQTHVDEMVREANLDEVRKEFQQIRSFDFKGQVERTIDADGSLRAAFQDPIAAHPPQPAGVMADAPALTEASVVAAHEATTFTTPADLDLINPLTPPPGDSPTPDAEPAAVDEDSSAPAFIPPTVVAAAPERPSFVPPGFTRSSDRPLRF